MPTLSIILPVYNHGLLLARSIESVTRQSSHDWELIIVNDGSSDDSLAVARKFADQNSQIKVLNRKHEGVSAAINAGVTGSEALYITFLAADDYYKSNHIEDNLEYLKNNPAVDLVMSKTALIGDPYVVDLEKPGAMIHLDDCAVGGTFFVRRGVFNAVGGRSEAPYGTDYYFAQEVIKAGLVVRKRNTRTYVYDRSGAVSITKLEEERLR